MVYVNYHYDLTEEQMQEIARRVQADLLQQAMCRGRGNRIDLSSVRELRVPFADEYDLTCCGMEMKYQDIFNVREYFCQHRYHHPHVYVNQIDGDMIREEEL